MIWLAVLMLGIGLSAAAGLSLVIRSHAHGVAISTVFMALSLIGLLSIEGRVGQYVGLTAGAGLIGCVAAIGVFRFWAGGAPAARAAASAAGLAVLSIALGTVAYLGIPG